MRNDLTATFVTKATAEAGAERTIFWDRKLPSFGLMVTSAGAKSFVVQYRAGQTSRRLTIKEVLSLAEARKEAMRLLGDVARGRDPLGERRGKQDAQKNTLRAVSEEYLRREGKNLRTAGQRRAILERLVFPKMGARQIADIKRSELVRLLDHIEDERGPAIATSVFAFVRKIMNWHAGRSDEFKSPVVRGMRGKSQGEARSRVLSDTELCSIWRTAEQATGPWGRFVQFLLLTATRRNEAARVRWDEVTGADWVIPASRYKNKLDTLIPLSKRAQSLLSELPRIEKCPYAFTTDGAHPISDFSKFKRRFDKSCGVTGWRLHDLRKTARTLLSRARVDADIAERCLGHAIGGIRATYDRHAYREEKAEAFEALAAQIERIVNPQENVIALTRK